MRYTVNYEGAFFIDDADGFKRDSDFVWEG